MEEKPLKPLNIPLTGKLKTSVDGSQLSEGDFQELQNMRYTNAGLKSIGGMTKINTSVTALGDFLKFRAGIHFVKDEPSESHVLVQAWDTGTTPHIYRYDNAIPIPGTGTFNSTILYTESSGAGIGTFSTAPDGCVAYCNGKESLIWGGDEYRIGAFLDTNGLGNDINYTTIIKNTLQTTGNTVNLRYATSANIPIMMLHFNTDLTDSAGTPHIMTGHGGVAVDTGTKRFGAASAFFGGVNSQDYITTPDATDLDFSGGGWTIDFWMYAASPGTAVTWQIYYQQTDVNNYFSIFYNVSLVPTQRRIYLKIYTGSAIKVQIYADVTAGEWNHVRVAENGSDYCIFINGILQGYALDATNKPLNYTGTVYIGYNPNSATSYFNGWIDDFKIDGGVSLTKFIPYQTEVDNSVKKTFVYVASSVPLKGIKLYLLNVNNSTSAIYGTFWNGSKWKELTNISDGTSSGGIALSSNGEVAFDSTAATARPKEIERIHAYWYLFTWSGLAGSVGLVNASIYHATVDAPMQQIKDIWDGIKRICYGYFLNTTDYTTRVVNFDYLSSDATTFVTLDNLATASYQLAGFSERMTGLYVDLPAGHVNTVHGTMITIYYWNGSAWISVGVIDDGTMTTIASFSRSGYITWNGSIITDENTQIVAGNGASLYYYKIQFSEILSADVKLDYISGIPAPKTIANYKFPVNYHNRLWLCSDQSGERNKIAVSSTGTVSIFNGTDTTNFYIGDNTDIIAGGSLYGRYASSISEQLILCKIDETWLIEGTALSNYSQFRVSNQYGCVAPKTFTICNIGYAMAAGISKHVAIWQSSNAIVVFDGSTVMPVSFDIADIFDQRNTLSNGTPFRIDLSMIHKSTAFYDEANSEWHWCWSSDGSTLNNEYVYDLIRQKWYTINRGVAIQLGIPVRDTNGNKYVYGAIDTGYLERLENGNTFDGNNIISKFRTPDIPIAGWEEESLIRKVSLLTKTKATTTNTVAITHYGDMANTGTSIGNLSVTDATKRVRRSMVSIGTGPYTFHSFECSMTTSDEAIGFEPIGLQIFYKAIRAHLI